MSARTPVCLTIASSDSGGGAGIQADLKAFANAGVHGTSAIAGLTAQSTVAVTRIEPVPPAMIVEQVRTVVDDIDVSAVKIGMVGDHESILAVAEAVRLLPAGTPIVLDPVMVAESGARLLQETAHRTLVEALLPVVTVVTPNLPEALVLAGDAREFDAEAGDELVVEVARAVAALGPQNVLITGGHRGRAHDVLLRADGRVRTFPGERYPDGAAHGSGCTHSSTLAARLALGDDLERAAAIARQVAGHAVRRGLRDVGVGAGPVDVLDLPALRERAERAAAGVPTTERMTVP